MRKLHGGIVLFFAAAAAGNVGPRMLQRPTRHFSIEGAVIVTPPRFKDAVRALSGRRIAPVDALDETGLRWRADLQGKPLVVVGSLGNNRALLPLYAAFLDVTDAYHPGGDGFVVRKLVTPRNILVLGGSSDAGTRRAIKHYLRQPSGPTTIELGGEAANRVPKSPRNTMPLDAWLFLLRGERRFADKACEGLRRWTTDPEAGFRASDYQLEPLARGYRMLTAHGVLSPDEMAFFDNVWLRTLIANQNKYWRARDGRRIGSRHQTMGTSAFHFIVRLLLADGAPNDEARVLLERWDRECRAYFDNALRTFHDDIEGIPSYHSVQPMLHWALEMGRSQYLGRQLPLAVERALAVTDPLGAYAGTGTYEEARRGTVRKGIMLGYPLAALAYITGDPRWAWLRREVAPETATWGVYAPWGAHGFAVPTREGREPLERLGLQAVPLGPCRRARLGDAAPPPEHLFEKLAWRSAWERSAAYMVLQGWQGARADNMAPEDANAILRYTNRGRIWLFTNCRKAGPFYRNAVFVSPGRPSPSRPGPACELLFRREQAGTIMTATRLTGCNGADWTRYIWWLGGRAVIAVDRLRFTRSGRFAVLCTWRSPRPARLAGRVWTARTDDSTFRLVNVDGDLKLRAERGPLDGAALPYFLRQRRTLEAGIGQEAWFRNVFAVDQAFAAAPVGPDGVALRGLGTARVTAEGMVWKPWKEGEPALEFIEAKALPENAAPPAASVPASPFRLPRQVVDGIRVSADPAPERGAVESLTDPLASAYSSATWSREARPTLTVRLPRRERPWSIELRLPMAAARNALPEKMPPPFETTVNGRTVRFVPELDLLPLHKGTVYPFVRMVARDLQIEADTLRFQTPLTRIRRVRVRSERPAPLRLVHFEARDIDGDGTIELVAATAERELLVLDAAGRTKWRQRFPSEITAVHVDREILVATRGARLHCIDAAGRQRWTTSFLDVPDLAGDCPTAYSIARMGNRIVTGNYARATFIEPGGRVLNATFAYGAFETGWLPDIGDVNDDGVPDALLYNVWGTCSLIDGKARRTMGYVACPRGSLRLLRVLDPPETGDHRVLVVSENGATMLNPATRKPLWRQAIAPVACATWFAGRIAIAKSEGALLLLDDSGNIVAENWLDGTPAAMAATGKELYVADTDGVHVLDAGLRLTRVIPRRCTALAIANGAVFGVTPAGVVLRLR